MQGSGGAFGGGNATRVDLSAYVLQDELESRTPEVDLTGYALETYVNDYVTTAIATAIVSGLGSLLTIARYVQIRPAEGGAFYGGR